ncbi:MAG: methyl-accepting chemotaxis protein [Desulfobacterium sp.]|nr:methyl-accepting chemotaxis protein [Desulfobacterium sp.]MBU3949011.1 methyl-accepting chemotaxis protein [Pseudomonadota bacterium]MBU4010709.1 methyl-accepting chemotaxis protein [Pseudomonadota bacterium]MBU4035502.1 methyl-accepting chemotaxis protein [Pseudomonadota bacterium]
MKWFIDISTRNKLFAGFGMMILITVTVSILSYVSITGLHNTLVKLFEAEVPLSLEIVKSKADMSMERMILARMMETNIRSDLDLLMNNIKENDKSINSKIKTVEELGNGNADYMKLIDQLVAARKEFITIRDTKTIPLVYAGKNTEAKKYFFGTQFEQYEKIMDIVANLSKLSEQSDRALMQVSAQKVRDAFILFLFVGFVGVSVGLIMALYLTMIIARPLKEITEIAEKIAYGDLTVRLPPAQRADEVGNLLLSFGMMVESQKMMTKEISDTVDVLAEHAARQTDAEAHGLNSLVQKLKGLVTQYKI